jgi:hypothetical protein
VKHAPAVIQLRVLDFAMGGLMGMSVGNLQTSGGQPRLLHVLQPNIRGTQHVVARRPHPQDRRRFIVKAEAREQDGASSSGSDEYTYLQPCVPALASFLPGSNSLASERTYMQARTISERVTLEGDLFSWCILVKLQSIEIWGHDYPASSSLASGGVQYVEIIPDQF